MELSRCWEYSITVLVDFIIFMHSVFPWSTVVPFPNSVPPGLNLNVTYEKWETKMKKVTFVVDTEFENWLQLPCFWYFWSHPHSSRRPRPARWRHRATGRPRCSSPWWRRMKEVPRWWLEVLGSQQRVQSVRQRQWQRRDHQFRYSSSVQARDQSKSPSRVNTHFKLYELW